MAKLLMGGVVMKYRETGSCNEIKTCKNDQIISIGFKCLARINESHRRALNEDIECTCIAPSCLYAPS